MSSVLDGYTSEQLEKALQAILKRRESDHRYKQEHKDVVAERTRRHKQERKVEIAEYDRQRYQEHKNERLEHDRQYYRLHPEVRKASEQKRRAAKSASEGCFTSEEFRLLCEVHGGRCFYCTQVLPLGPDHKVPLSRGGSNDIDNIVPACKSCNSRKRDKTLEEFLL